MADALDDCIRAGIREFDFLGPDMEWKRDWTDERRAHSWLYIFQDNVYGRALRDARFKWAVLAKGLITKWRKH